MQNWGGGCETGGPLDEQRWRRGASAAAPLARLHVHQSAATQGECWGVIPADGPALRSLMAPNGT